MKTKLKDFNLNLPSLGAAIYEILEKNIGYLANCFADCPYRQGYLNIVAL